MEAGGAEEEEEGNDADGVTLSMIDLVGEREIR